MPEPLCILCCGHIRAEAGAVCGLLGVRSGAFPARCGRPPVTWEELEAARESPEERLVVLGGACLGRLDEGEAEARGITLRRIHPCAAMVLNPRLVDALVREGAYLLTPGWLKDWRTHLDALGRDRRLLREVWREGAITRLVLLDTGPGDPGGELQALSGHLGIPWEILPTGLDHLQLLVEREVLGARMKSRCGQLEGELSQARRQAADRATAMDFLGTLSQSLREEDVAEGMGNLFRMLFHAEEVDLLPAGDLGGGAYRETGDGFEVALGTSLGPVGHLRVRGLGFPQFKAHYLNLALSMAGVCALAVQNARACRAAEESRAYQRMMLDILDVFYAPQGTPEDIGKVLEILQTFAGVDALALEVEGSGGPGWTRARGYPPRLMELDCRRCVDALAGNGAGAPPGGAMTNARGTLWMDDLGTECLCGVEGFRSAAFVRLPLREGFQGWLQLHHRGSGHFTQVLLERIEGAARTVSIGLERRWAESDLRTANQELEDRVRQRTGELDARNQELRQEVLERTRAEETRDKVEQQLLQSQKLEALGTLAGGIAHDFNNALTPIVSLADLELGTLPVDGPLHQHLEIIRDAAGRAKGLVDQILLFSRRKAPHLITLELKPLVEEILLLVRATFPATIEIRQNLGECGLVKGDPSQIHQVVLNLCTNAFHAMQESGGMLKVGLEGVSLEPGDLLCVQGLAPGPYARLEVSDTGVGMSPEVQARIFEPFFTTKGAGKGTGLGLSVVHGIVASCRGHIAVYSEPGLGTTFRVFLPLAGDGAAKWEEPAASTAVPRGSERILVVDDEGLIRTALCEILGSLGYGTRPAAGGAEALALFLEDPEAFDLVITDMTMPRMTGLELARRIRVRRPEARIVMCSGFSEQVGPEELSDHGIREFVQKPFAVALVAQAVRRELDR